MAQETSSLRFGDVVKTYGDRSVLNHVALSVESGAITALSGVNGSGKSTLFRIAAGFVRATSGTVTIDGFESGRLSITEFAPSQRVRMGLAYISQERRLLRGLSTLGNFQAASSAHSTGEILDALGELRLLALLDKNPRQMEAADVVRLLLAKAYLARPRFLIVDEPFAGLSSAEVDQCVAIMQRMRERGTGVVVTDHHWSPILEMADTAHIIQNGAIVFSASADAARTSAEARRLYFRRRA